MSVSQATRCRGIIVEQGVGFGHGCGICTVVWRLAMEGKASPRTTRFASCAILQRSLLCGSTSYRGNNVTDKMHGLLLDRTDALMGCVRRQPRRGRAGGVGRCHRTLRTASVPPLTFGAAMSIAPAFPQMARRPRIGTEAGSAVLGARAQCHRRRSRAMFTWMALPSIAVPLRALMAASASDWIGISTKPNHAPPAAQQPALPSPFEAIWAENAGKPARRADDGSLGILTRAVVVTRQFTSASATTPMLHRNDTES
jgi:hypothetical protein